jgi:hypothetical protein
VCHSRLFQSESSGLPVKFVICRLDARQRHAGMTEPSKKVFFQGATMFPPFILAKLYVKGSLKNTDTGFEFSLKNIIDATMLSGIGPIVVGEKSYEGATITLAVGDKQWQGDQIDKTNLVPVKMGVPLRVLVQGDPLPAGEVKVSVTATTSDIGKIKFDVKDKI